MYIILVSILVSAYLLGSIPFGLLLTRAAKLGDIRSIGSGNIGATNVMRTGNKMLGVLTLLMDTSKGFLAIEIAKWQHMDAILPFVGLLAVVGHIFPVWLRFKGGKGVATTIGVLLGLDWVLGLIVCALWLLVFLLVRISSLASMLSIVYSTAFAYLLGREEMSLLSMIFSVLIVFTHRHNIQRLLQGSEHNFKLKDS